MKYYQLMIQLDEHDEKFLNVSRHYNAIYSTKKIKETLPDALQVCEVDVLLVEKKLPLFLLSLIKSSVSCHSVKN